MKITTGRKVGKEKMRKTSQKGNDKLTNSDFTEAKNVCNIWHCIRRSLEQLFFLLGLLNTEGKNDNTFD